MASAEIKRAPSDSADTSPGADDSDYYTPEDPSTGVAGVAGVAAGHFLVDQGTDTSLDTPMTEAPATVAEGTAGGGVSPAPSSTASTGSAKGSPDAMAMRRRRVFEDRCSPVHEEERPIELVEVKATTPLAPTGSTTTFEASMPACFRNSSTLLCCSL